MMSIAAISLLFSMSDEQAVRFSARGTWSSSLRHFRRAAILTVPIIPITQVVIHAHHNILVSDPHPAHIVLCAAFDRLFYRLSRIRCRRLPVLPYEVDKAIGGGVR